MDRFLMCIYITVLTVAVSACSNGPIEQTKLVENPDFVTTSPLVHDPVMAKENGEYYIFATGHGIAMMLSHDMINWQIGEPVFKEVPEWVKSYIPEATDHIWAPDIIKKDNKWHLFYSCSLFGRNKSVIGHAVSESLKSRNWVDLGIMVSSVPNRDMWNAIDPNIVEGDNGDMWMAFGSFWDGIMMVRLTDDLMTVSKPEEWYNIASRYRAENTSRTEAGDGAIEAPFIFKKAGWYYLFVSFDYCCRGEESSYKVVVGRSRSVTGPYLDRDGVDMCNGGGTLVVEGDKVNWQAIGHCSVYNIDGKDVYLSHAYEAGSGKPRLIIRDIIWNNEWPSIEL